MPRTIRRAQEVELPSIAAKRKVRQFAESVANYSRRIGLKQVPVELNGFTYRLSFGKRDLVVAYLVGYEKPCYHLHFGEEVHLKKVDLRPLPFGMIGDAIDALAKMQETLQKIEQESKVRARQWLCRLEELEAMMQEIQP